MLTWQENVRTEEMPPEWMWPFDDLIVEWFDELKQKREAETGKQSDRPSGPMIQNELAKGRGRNS